MAAARREAGVVDAALLERVTGRGLHQASKFRDALDEGHTCDDASSSSLLPARRQARGSRRVRGDPEPRVRDRDELLCAMTWRASQQFEACNFAAAERAYRDILGYFPNDPVAGSPLRECRERRTSLVISC
jgi:hypothetical protein